MFLPEPLKIIFGIILLAFWALSVLAHRNPNVPWLQAFNFRNRLTPEQQKRLRRSNNSLLNRFQPLLASTATA